MEESFSKDNIRSVLSEKQNGINDDKHPKKGQRENNQKPQSELDLHGYTGQEAKKEVQYFIESSFRKGLKVVRIITGRGVHSDIGKLILPSVTEDKLNELKRKNFVVNYKWDNYHNTRGGSVIVFQYPLAPANARTCPATYSCQMRHQP